MLADMEENLLILQINRSEVKSSVGIKSLVDRMEAGKEWNAIIEQLTVEFGDKDKDKDVNCVLSMLAFLLPLLDQGRFELLPRPSYSSSINIIIICAILWHRVIDVTPFLLQIG
jgi:hypothetical protein